jgi:uncharacterized repeat protein (TIGR01451 family)
VLAFAAGSVAFVAAAAVSGKTSWISRPAFGSGQVSDSAFGRVSIDGRLVAFASSASNLVSGDTNGQSDVFVRAADSSGATELVSVAPSGGQFWGGASTPAISEDGRYVAFIGDDGLPVGGPTPDIYLRDRVAGATELVTDGGEVQAPSISGDGRLVVFSTRNALVPEDVDTYQDIYAFDRVTKAFTLLSVNDPQGVRFQALSADGTRAAWVSDSFPQGFVLATVGGSVEKVTVSTDGQSVSLYGLSLSRNGRFVAYTSGTSNVVGDSPCPSRIDGNCADVFVYDTQTHANQLVSVDTAGVRATTGSGSAAISADGRYVAFQSPNALAPPPVATPYVPCPFGCEGSIPIFVRDLVANTTSMVSLTNDGQAADGKQDDPSISGHGETIVFESTATNLDSSDPSVCLSTVFVNVPVSCRDIYARTTVVTADPPTPSGGGGSGGANPDVALLMTADRATAVAGDLISFQLDTRLANPVQSSGGTNLVLTDVLPGSLQFVSVTTNRGSCTGGQTVTCNLDFIAAGLVATVQIVARVTIAGSFTNTATVVEDQTDVLPANNTAAVRITAPSARAPLTPPVIPKNGHAAHGVTRIGTRGADIIRGTSRDDILSGLAGNDRILGLAGDDRIAGGKGRDIVIAGAGDDTITTRDGEHDTISCGPGTDTAIIDRLDTVTGCENTVRQ